MRDLNTSPRSLEIKRDRRARKMRLLFLFFVLFIVIVGALSYFSGNKRIVINEIKITGTHIINQEDIKEEVQKYISGKYIYLFAKNNSFIYPHNKTYENLILNFPRIEKLSVRRNGLNIIHVDITERVGSYLYCGASIPENKEEIGENCYFINNDGFIFDKAPYFSGNIYFKYYMFLENKEDNPLGKQMMSIDDFHKLARFVDGITSIGFEPIYIFKDKDGTDYLYLNHSVGGTSPKILFKDYDNLDIIQDNLAIAMRKKEFADEINSKYNTLLYIDLRFPNKVLYKFQ